MPEDQIQENERHHNKCLQFETAEGVEASEVLEQYEEATAPENPDGGPVLTKWSGKENEVLAEGYPWTSYSWTRSGDLKVSDDRGSITIDGGLISHASGMHGLS